MSTEAQSTGETTTTTEQARVRTCKPDRAQLVMISGSLDDMVPADHPARVVWAAVEQLEMSRFYEPIKVREDSAGRSATDPRLLFALWLQAATDGIASGRQLEELCTYHAVYRWLCGGVGVNYHTLNDFRVGHRAALDEVLTQVLGRLMHAGLVSVQRVTQDGTKVRASAGADSFKRRGTLEESLAQAKAHVTELSRLAEESPAEGRSRSRANQERVAADRAARVAAALEAVEQVEATKAQQKDKPSKHSPARASTTDAGARFMKMPDGGYRPAYNVQLAQDPQSRAIVGVAVTGDGNDRAQAEPMRRQVEQRTGQAVQEHLYDGGTLTLADVERADAAGVTVYAPVPEPKKAGQDRFEPRPDDSDAVAAWRQRMGTAAAQAVYKLRASTSEPANADLKTHRGLGRLMVRGTDKVLCVALWSALAYNLMHFGHALAG
jgi:transposase